MRWKQAIDRSPENRAVCVVHRGSVTQASVLVEFFDESSVYVYVERPGVRSGPDGKPAERYVCNAGVELALMLTKLGVGTGDWSPL